MSSEGFFLLTMTGRAATATEEALHHERRVQDMAILCLSRKKKKKKSSALCSEGHDAKKKHKQDVNKFDCGDTTN